jgi:hypothetical protein
VSLQNWCTPCTPINHFHFDGVGIFFGSFEFFNGFIGRVDGFIGVGSDLLNLLISLFFFFSNLFLDGYIGSSFLTC